MTIIINKNTSKKDFVKLLSSLVKIKKSKGVDLTKYNGIIQLKKDPLQIQKEMRNDWK